jgi:hypothetical protein
MRIMTMENIQICVPVFKHHVMETRGAEAIGCLQTAASLGLTEWELASEEVTSPPASDKDYGS